MVKFFIFSLKMTSSIFKSGQTFDQKLQYFITFTANDACPAVISVILLTLCDEMANYS